MTVTGPASTNVSPANGRVPRSRRRTRVLQVNYRHTFGGSERLAATIGTSLDPNRFESTFAAMKGDGEVGETLRAQGYSTYVFGRNEGFDPLAVWRVWKFLKQNPVDILQTHHVGSLVYCAGPAKLLGMKIVHTEHDVHSFRRLPNEMRWIKRLARYPDHFIAIDPTIADFLADEVGVPRDKISVIRNGVNLDQFSRPAQADPRRPFTAGWVSRLAPPKRPDVFVEAIALVAQQDPTIRVRIIGGGEQLEGLQQQINDLGLTDRIDCLGPRDDVALQLQQIDCYVLCSEREGLPISLVEAMATELPTIVSAVGGIPNLIKDGHNGFLLDSFEPQDLARLILQVRRNPEAARTVGSQGRVDACERFDLKQTIRQYMQVFDQVMAGRIRHSTSVRLPSDVKKASYRVLCGMGADHWARGRACDRLLIVGYHGVARADRAKPPSWLILPEHEFERQIRYLKENYDVVSMTQAAEHIASGKPFSQPTACITFDDGYLNNMTVAAPILKRHGVPATIYLATGLVGTQTIHWTSRLERALLSTRENWLDLNEFGLPRYRLGKSAASSFVRLVARLYRFGLRERNAIVDHVLRTLQSSATEDFSDFTMMTWDELTQLDKSGFIEFGGHTVHHQIVEPLNDQELSDEIGGSIDEVHRRLTSVSRTFAYPNGTPEDFDERAERVLRQHGVIAAVSTVEGVNTSKSNRFALKRVTIGSQMSLDEFRMRASGLIDKMKRWVYPSSAAT